MKNEPVRLRARVVFDFGYNAIPCDYETDDVDRMIEIDLKNARDSIGFFLRGEKPTELKIWRE